MNEEEIERKGQLRFGFTCSEKFNILYNEASEINLNRLGISRNHLDFGQNAVKYFTEGFSIDENANAKNFNAANFENEVVKPWLKLDSIYMLHKQLEKQNLNANQIVNRVFEGELYIHDLHALFDRPYCCGVSTGLLKAEGLPFSDLQSKPAKRSSSFMDQAAELIFILSNFFVGATAVSDILLYYASFLENEKSKTDDEITQDFQSFIFKINQKLRSSSQSPFSNLTIYDTSLIESMISEGAIDVDVDRVLEVQDLWMSYFGRGTNGLPFRFPITSLNLQIDNENNIIDHNLLFKSCQYGTKLAPFNYYTDIGRSFTSCCRLVSSINDIRNLHCDTWGSGVNVGSMRVCNLNLLYQALKARNDSIPFYEELYKVLIDAINILEVQRIMINKKIDQNFIPVFKPYGWLTEKYFFSTIGVLGLWEAGKILSNSDNPIDIVLCMKEILKLIEETTHEESIKRGFPINTEFVPAETAAYKLAEAVNKKFKTNYELLSNQIIPLDYEMGLGERIKYTGELIKTFTGGALLHINLNEVIDEEAFRNIVIRSTKLGINHLAVNYIFGICKNMHGFKGNICPYCGYEKVDDLTRIVGYYTPKSRWNKMRQIEQRQFY